MEAHVDELKDKVKTTKRLYIVPFTSQAINPFPHHDKCWATILTGTLLGTCSTLLGTYSLALPANAMRIDNYDI